MKSPEKIAEALVPIVSEVGMSIAKFNYLKLPLGSPAHKRFVIGAHILSNLWCQEMVTSHDADQLRALDVCRLLTEWHITAVSQCGITSVPVTDFVVWSEEHEWIQSSPISPKLAGVRIESVRLPLADIVRELYAVRFMRCADDTLKGSMVQSQQGSWSLALYMPVCSSLIMQTTADPVRAADKETVTGFAASLQTQLFFLQASVQQQFQS